MNHVNNERDDPRVHITLYTRKKIQKYKSNTYHAYLFIVLEDTSSTGLISKNNDPIIQLLKICRHMNISYAKWVQTVP
jgi:hypothetical protein